MAPGKDMEKQKCHISCIDNSLSVITEACGLINELIM